MKALIYELRLLLAESMMDWMLSVAPPGKERTAMAVVIHGYLRWRLSSTG